MVARAASSNKLVVTAAAFAVASVILVGCGRSERPRWRAPTLRTGYAYTAALMAQHPLYAALADLEAALADLGDGEWTPVLPPLDTRLASVLMAQSLRVDPRASITDLQEDWRVAYPALQLPGDALTEDLQARIVWERRQADSEVVARMARAEAEEGRRLAQLRAALVRQYQERLTNLRIDAALGDDAATERAITERERVGQAIEAELAAEQAAGRELLAELESRLRDEAAERIAAIQRRAETVESGRRGIMQAAGGALYAEMAAAMLAPWGDSANDEAQIMVEADAANRHLEGAEGSRQAAEAARGEVAEQQRLRLLRALGQLRRQLKSETEIAARVVAHREGIELRLVPGRAPQGQDVTSSLAGQLKDFWSLAERRRS